jgi:hypothetical protein
MVALVVGRCFQRSLSFLFGRCTKSKPASKKEQERIKKNAGSALSLGIKEPSGIRFCIDSFD